MIGACIGTEDGVPIKAQSNRVGAGNMKAARAVLYARAAFRVRRTERRSRGEGQNGIPNPKFRLVRSPDATVTVTVWPAKW
jgi:hypothetical protein